LLDTTKKQIYFVVSHFHQDHYNAEILQFHRPEGYITPQATPKKTTTKPELKEDTPEAIKTTERTEAPTKEFEVDEIRVLTEVPLVQEDFVLPVKQELSKPEAPLALNGLDVSIELTEPSEIPEVSTTAPNVPRLLLSYDTVRRQRVPKDLPSAILHPGDHYEDEYLKLTVYRSTDIGASVAVELPDGDTLFHAGDLNNWYFPEGDQRLKISSHEMEGLFLSSLRDIQMEYPHFTHVMFPLDPRLGKDALRGPSQWLTRFGTDNFYPMHYWAQHEIIANAIEELKYLFPYTVFHYEYIPDEALLYGDLLNQVIDPQPDSSTPEANADNGFPDKPDKI